MPALVRGKNDFPVSYFPGVPLAPECKNCSELVNQTLLKTLLKELLLNSPHA